MTSVPTPLNFRKSSYSSAQGENCVEVADLPSGAAVRDSQNPAEGHLAFSCIQWTALLGTVRSSSL
ncbi:DUF397 domain-containing protein [Nocardiopsis sp. HUAS JQ3]|uniref:DUF397 domain-containing protein n=1 Tax=Nocardiopsis sp. HUAS JQ3 TaxID=3061629 RepID=UPI0023A9837C|nr:DUF397 domain-containing protein [Nocardiopsis sp. HUAS JQ3]WDZ90809.1 DUF397 domain-containing protein [Nocardiopsis sp. HUAS JQ3]